MRKTEALRRLDALVGVAGRHPDVGHDDVRLLALDRVEQAVEVAADRHHLEPGLRIE